MFEARYPRMNYEAPLEEHDPKLVALTREIHGEVCGCDDKRCTLHQRIYDWLAEGDLSDNPSVDDLVTEFREYAAD